MIFQPLIDIGNWLLNLVLDNVDTVELSIPSGVYSAMDSLFSALGYLFPIKQLLPILVVSGVFAMARLIVAVVVRIKSFIPTMGN
jgi:membrane-associated phospholipid phosphatase